jgi:riboflavin biosynthesis pyrimidine reductase
MRHLREDPFPLDETALLAAYEPDRSRPCLRVNFVTSLDGAVVVDGRSEGLSSPADKHVFGLLRHLSDAVMVGAGTLRQERYGPARSPEPARQRRLARGLAEHPTLVIVSGTLDLDPAQRAFTEAPVRPVVLTHAGAPPGRRAALAAVADVVAVGAGPVDLRAGLAYLHSRGLTQVLCEGGPRLFDSLLVEDLVDELCLTISPLLVGGGPDRIVVGPGGGAPRPLRPVHLLEADGMLLTRYARA